MGSQKVEMKNVSFPYIFIFIGFAELWRIIPEQFVKSGYIENEEGHPISSVAPDSIEGRVRSLEDIFKSLHLTSDGCKEMLVCHLAKDPKEFSPLSQKVLDLLEVDNTALVTQYELLYREEVKINPTVLYLNLLQAVYSGAQQKSCDKFSSVCDLKGEEMINWILLYTFLLESSISLF